MCLVLVVVVVDVEVALELELLEASVESEDWQPVRMAAAATATRPTAAERRFFIPLTLLRPSSSSQLLYQQAKAKSP